MSACAASNTLCSLDPAVQKRGDFKEVINFSHALPDRLDQLMNPYLREHEPEVMAFILVRAAVCARG